MENLLEVSARRFKILRRFVGQFTVSTGGRRVTIQISDFSAQRSPGIKNSLRTQVGRRGCLLRLVDCDCHVRDGSGNHAAQVSRDRACTRSSRGDRSHGDSERPRNRCSESSSPRVLLCSVLLPGSPSCHAQTPGLSGRLRRLGWASRRYFSPRRSIRKPSKLRRWRLLRDSPTAGEPRDSATTRHLRRRPQPPPRLGRRRRLLGRPRGPQ